MSITIYGGSDDLIEVEGDLRLEFDVYEGWRWLNFNDGTIVKIGFGLVLGKGWHIETAKIGEGTVATSLEPIGEDDDRMELSGDITSVECWSSPEGPTKDDMEEFWGYFVVDDHPLENVVAAYRALKEDRNAKPNNGKSG